MGHSKNEIMEKTMKVAIAAMMPVEDLCEEMKNTFGPEVRQRQTQLIDAGFNINVAKRLSDTLGDLSSAVIALLLDNAMSSDDPANLVTFRLLLEKILAPLLDQIDSLKTTVKTMEISKEVGKKQEEKG